jgi:hypothetical protein
MASERQNMSEQEISIKAREHELYVPDADTISKPVKPFAVYLRETPAEPFSPTTKAILWTVGTVVGLLFLAACWRASMHNAPASRTRKTRAAVKTAMPVSPLLWTRDGPGFPVFYDIGDDAEYCLFKGSTDNDLLPDRSDLPGSQHESDADAIIGGTPS